MLASNSVSSTLSERRFILFHLFVQLQFYSQKTGTVKHNRQNGQNPGKTRPFLFMSGHFPPYIAGFEKLFLLTYDTLGIVPALFCFLCQTS